MRNIRIISVKKLKSAFNRKAKERLAFLLSKISTGGRGAYGQKCAMIPIDSNQSLVLPYL
jgi:hypothetical protein